MWINFGFLVAGVLIAAGIGWWVWQNPQVLGSIGKSFANAQTTVETAREELPLQASPRPAPRRSSTHMTVTSQVGDLHAGEFLYFAVEPNALERPEFMVVETGAYQPYNREGGQNYQPRRGETYPAYFLDNGVLLLKRLDGWFAFTRFDVLAGDTAKDFNAPNETFDQNYGQEPGSYTWRWPARNLRLTFQDVGYVKYHTSDRAQDVKEEPIVTEDVMIKYVLATNADKPAEYIYVENQMSGQDRLWFGVKLGEDLSPFVGQVTRAAA